MTFGEMGINANPLSWPTGWVRAKTRKRSNFKTPFARARDELFRELRLLGCPDWNVILSTNVPLRRDGLPYAGMAQPTDTGVAVYFKLENKPMVFACDTFLKVEENLYAIVKTIEAIRGIQRWGASEMMERTFTGFQALPAPKPAQRPWWEVLGVDRSAAPPKIEAAWRMLMRIHHPDRGGDPDRAVELNAAKEEGLRSYSR